MTKDNLIDIERTRCYQNSIVQTRKMRVRRSVVEHHFGTLKSWMGATHFLTKTLDHVSTEIMESLFHLLQAHLILEKPFALLGDFGMVMSLTVVLL